MRWHRSDRSENEIGREIILCAIEVHRTLGDPGLLESVYKEALAWKLSNVGLHVVRQVEVPITYKFNTVITPKI